MAKQVDTEHRLQGGNACLAVQRWQGLLIDLQMFSHRQNGSGPRHTA